MSAKSGHHNQKIKNNSAQDTTSANNNGNNRQRNNDNSLAFILIGIVLVFMICHSLRIFLAFYQVITHTLYTVLIANTINTVTFSD